VAEFDDTVMRLFAEESLSAVPVELLRFYLDFRQPLLSVKT
jgi:hypothetical protein